MDGSCFGEQGLALEHDRIVTRITNIRHQLSNVIKAQKYSLESRPAASGEIEHLYQQAQELEDLVEDWKSQFPNSWDFQKHKLPAWPLEGFYSPIAYAYPNAACAALWCRYFGVKILVASTRLRILYLHHLYEEEFIHENQSQCINQIYNTANDFASSIPFCLERIKSSPTYRNPIILASDDIKPHLASLVVWPLGIASGVAGVAPQHKMWFASQLTLLGRITGYGVLEAARGAERTTSAWSFFEA